MPRVTLKASANNEIRLQVDSLQPPRKAERDNAALRRSHREALKTEEIMTARRIIAAGLPIYEQSSAGRSYVRQPTEEYRTAKQKTPLDLRNEFARRSLPSAAKPGFGRSHVPRSFTRYARHSLLEAGAVVSDMFPLSGCYFVTLTIPGSTSEALKCVADWSSWILHRLRRVIQQPSNSDVGWFYVWELQQRGALHLHLLVASQDGALSKEIAHSVEFKWFELLLELQDKAGVDVFGRHQGGSWRNFPHKWQSDVQVVRKNVGAYVAKYATKPKHSNDGSRLSVVQGQTHSVARWWGSNHIVKQAVQRRRQSFSVLVSAEQARHLARYLDGALFQFGTVYSHRYDFDIHRVFRDSIGTLREELLGAGNVLVVYLKPDFFHEIEPLLKLIWHLGLEEIGLVSAYDHRSLTPLPPHSKPRG